MRDAPSLLHVLAGHVRADAARTACVFRDAGGGELAISRGALWQQAQAFAARLRRAGAPRGAPFLVALPSRPEMLTTFLGAMLAGLVPAFMPYATAKQNAALFWGAHRELFARIGCRHFLTFAGNAVLAEAAPAGASVLLVEDIADWFRSDGASPPYPDTPLSAAPGDTALLQHTSGTTGLKKGVMLSHGAILRQVSAYAEAIDFGADDTIVSWLPLYHDMGLIACLLMPLLVGARLVLLDPFEWVAKPTSLLDAAERHRATFCWLPNFAFLHLCRAAPPEQVWDLASLKAVIDCSEPCKVATLARFYERFEGCGLRRAALRTCYAMAENVFAVTQTAGRPRSLAVDRDAMEIDGRIAAPSDDGHALALCSCGPPIAGAEIEIRDAARRPLGERTIGEIAIRTPCLFDGYNAMPQATAAALADGWYSTGDLGFLDAGELFVTGRKDDLIIVYGRNYYAHAVEEAASTCAGVVPGRAVAFALDNEATGSRDAVLLVEADGGLGEREMRRAIKARVFDATGLTLHSVKVFARGTLVKSTAGKISRAENRRLYVSEGSAA